MDEADDPEGLGVVGAVAVKAEDDSKDNAAEVTTGTREARDDAVGEGVHMRHEGKVGAVAGLEEEGHKSRQSEHRRPVVRVHAADGDEEEARENTADRDPGLL